MFKSRFNGLQIARLVNSIIIPIKALTLAGEGGKGGGVHATLKQEIEINNIYCRKKKGKPSSRLDTLSPNCDIFVRKQFRLEN